MVVPEPWPVLVTVWWVVVVPEPWVVMVTERWAVMATGLETGDVVSVGTEAWAEGAESGIGALLV